MKTGKEATQFKPGQSGNPSGKPKGAISLKSALRKVLREDPVQFAELVQAMLLNARQGNPKAMEIVRYALDGPELKAHALSVADLSNEQILELLSTGDSSEDSETESED